MCFAMARMTRTRMPSEWRNRILVLCAKVSGIVGVVRRNSKVKGCFYARIKTILAEVRRFSAT